VPAAEQIAYVAMSPDCQSVAMAVKTSAGVELHINGKSTATADEIPFATYSPDGSRLAYAARCGNSWSVVVDGVKISAGEQPPSQLTFSADGRNLGYVITSNAGKRVVVDWKEEDTAYLDIKDLRVDGTEGRWHVAYATSIGKDRWVAVHDGAVVGKTYKSIEHLCLGPSGQRVAFVGCLDSDATHADRFEVVADDAVFGPYFAVTAPPVFSGGGRLMFGACRAIGALQRMGGPGSRQLFPLEFFSVADGKEDRSHGQVCRIFFCLGDKRVALLIDSMGGNAASTGGGPGGIIINQPNNGNWMVMDDGESLAALMDFGGEYANLTLSADGVQIACSREISEEWPSRPGIWSTHVNKLDGPQFNQVGPPIFAADGLFCAYAAEREAYSPWFIVRQRTDNTPPSENGPGLVCPSCDTSADGGWHPDVDIERSGQTSIDNGHSYNGQIPYHFDPDGTLVYFRIADGHLYRVHWKPDDATTLPTTKP
jgi:hypothetical protein